MTKRDDKLLVFEKLCLALSQQEPYRVPTVGTPRRGAVAAILRWHCPHEVSESHKPRSIKEFFEQDWIKEGGQAEILFMQRATRKGDRWSGHVAFPGGKDEPGESDEDTVCREVLEEIGIDLKSEDYLRVGQLDEREISSIKDNKLLMILVPFVYLQLIPNSPAFQLQTSEVASVRWVPLDFFLSSQPVPYQPITEPLSLVRQINSTFIRSCLDLMFGTITFASIDLPPTTDPHLFRLWGLTMGMTKDIVKLVDTQHSFFYRLTTRNPTFSRLDIGLLTFLVTWFRVHCSQQTSTQNDWDNLYWKSIRMAVVLAIVFRASVLLGLLKLFIF
ncbi:hypothetical protein G6F37_003406 [Rhizopus arrhizus]|nr:hypothetical protein G6F38_006068 [Rhizopus arrhizus]KAG1161077.1 hypothetical protein G6F37_003406 [Rhizopus arrhizus]